MKINEQIATLRKQKGVTQGELASALGVTNQSVSKWESGQCCPDIQLIPEIAKYFDVSIDELMGEQTPQKDSELNDLPKKEGNINDPLLNEAVDLLAEQRVISTSVLQRKMGVGYQKARELIEMMQAQGHIIEVNPGFYRRVQSQQELLWALAKTVSSKSHEEISNAALAMHAALFLKKQKAESSVDSAVTAVINGQWGYSAFSEPDITTVMRGQSVFYSKNRSLDFNHERIGRLCTLMKVLSDCNHLKVLATLYELTVHAEDAYVDASEIAERSELSQEVVIHCLEETLFAYLLEKNKKYRIKGENMALLPILSILCY